GSGEALILIHGLGANADSWRPQVEALARNNRVIAMDLRGHGQSGFRAEEPISLRAFADDVAALMAKLRIEQAHFCGISMGGMIALEIFVRYGYKVKSLILADTTAFFPPPQAREELLRHFDSLEMMEWGHSMARRVLRREAPPEQRREVAQMLAANRRAIYRQGLIATFESDYRWVLPQVNLPTLILVGREDQATPAGYAGYLHKNIAGSVLQVIPQAGHFANLENPAAFNWQVCAHLKRCQEAESGAPETGKTTVSSV
ncbi:MAG TPA: alpha/beta fold hydrolase, partial [Desulfobaccales bacterium]|nr:alpha/beta fold hydrolase [Desulfobaccales bacterium]